MNFEKLLQPIDIYCERIDFTFWSEPLNAWSNLGFLIAAFLLYRKIKHDDIPTKWVLPFFLALVGVFSFLFHTTARVGTAFLDSLFILIFGCIYLFYFSNQLLKMTKKNSLILSIVFAIISFAFPSFLSREILNGSLGYLPYFLAVIFMTVWVHKKNRAGRQYFLFALLSFCISLFFRTIDTSICDQFYYGTHFLWHTFNSFMLYFLTWGYYVSQRTSKA